MAPKKHLLPKKTELSSDDLAIMIAKGFAGTATKRDFAALKTELAEEMRRLETRVGNQMHALYQDLKHEVKLLIEKVPHLEAGLSEPHFHISDRLTERLRVLRDC
jgi:hypothetical protein